MATIRRAVKLDAVLDETGEVSGTAETFYIDEMTPEAQEQCKEARAGDCYREGYNMAMSQCQTQQPAQKQKVDALDPREKFMQNQQKSKPADARATLMAHNSSKAKRDTIDSREALMARMAS